MKKAFSKNRTFVPDDLAVSYMPFSSMEPILQMQGALLSICGDAELQAKHLLHVVKWSLQFGEKTSAWNALTKAKILAKELKLPEFETAVMLQEAIIHRKEDNLPRAKALARSGFCRITSENKAQVQVALCCGMKYADWLTKTQSGSSNDIEGVLTNVIKIYLKISWLYF